MSKAHHYKQLLTQKFSSGACSYDDTNRVESLTFPSVSDLEPFQSSILYNTGDSILFDTPDESDLFLNLDLIGTPVVWDDIDCSSISSESAFGDDGDTLGCINAGVSVRVLNSLLSHSSLAHSLFQLDKLTWRN